MTVHDPTLSHLKKTSNKCDNLGTFTLKVLFLDYNKTKTEKSVTSLGHGLYMYWVLRVATWVKYKLVFYSVNYNN